MRYYLSKTGGVFAYETDNDRLKWGEDGLVEITQSQVDDMLILNHSRYAPDQITKAQGKSVLIISGLWDQILDYVSSIDDPQRKLLAEVALNDTTHWNRDSPFLNEAAQHIGLTDDQLDDLFIQAAEINL